MTRQLIETVEHAFACAAAPQERRIEVTHRLFLASRKAAGDFLSAVNSTDLSDEEVRRLRSCVLPIINLLYLPIEWTHDLAFGPHYYENLREAKAIAERRSQALSDALDTYDITVRQLLEISEHDTDQNPGNPIVTHALQLLTSILANSNGLVCVPVRGWHKPAWASLFARLALQTASRVHLCLPSVLREQCPHTIFTIGPVHPWNRGRFGWPCFLRSAPVAPLLANIRWHGDADRDVQGFYITDGLKWDRKIEVIGDSVSVGNGRSSWDQLTFEELYAPGRNSGPDQQFGSSRRTGAPSRVRFITGDQKVRNLDLAIGQDESRFMVANLEGHHPGPVRTVRQHIESNHRRDDGALLMIVLDERERQAAHEEQRSRAPSDLRRDQSAWKSALRRRLDQDRDSLLADLARVSSNDSTLCSLQNLRNWADASTGGTYGPADKEHLRLLLQVLELENSLERYWAVIELYRLMGRRLGFQLSGEIKSAIEERIRSIDDREWEELDAGNEVELELEGLDVALKAQRLEAIEPIDDVAGSNGDDASPIF